MPFDDEITDWIHRLRRGDSRAAQAIWEGYFDKLAALSRQKLASVPRRAADEEDVALSALKSFCQGIVANRFPKLDDRHDLWKVLVTITSRKVLAQRRRHFSKKRGGGKVRGESVFLPLASQPAEADGIDQVLGREPTPELAATLAEQCSGLLAQLDDRLKPIALAKMEGFSNQEIAERLDVALRTVERRLGQIRQIWSAQSEPSDLS